VIRVDLAGNAVGVVTTDEAAHAAARLAEEAQRVQAKAANRAATEAQAKAAAGKKAAAAPPPSPAKPALSLKAAAGATPPLVVRKVSGRSGRDWARR
jgi:sRNA-binding protein